MKNKHFILVIISLILSSFSELGFCEELTIKESFNRTLNSLGEGNFQQRKLHRANFSKTLILIINSEKLNDLIPELLKVKTHSDPEIRYQALKIIYKLFSNKETTTEAIKFVVAGSKHKKEFLLKNYGITNHLTFLKNISLNDKIAEDEEILLEFFTLYLANHLIEVPAKKESAKKTIMVDILFEITNCISKISDPYLYSNNILPFTTYNNSSKIITLFHQYNPDKFASSIEIFFGKSNNATAFINYIRNSDELQKNIVFINSFAQFINNKAKKDLVFVEGYISDIINIFNKIKKVDMISEGLVLLLSAYPIQRTTHKSSLAIQCLINNFDDIKQLEGFDKAIPNLLKIIQATEKNIIELSTPIKVFELISKYAESDQSEQIKQLLASTEIDYKEPQEVSHYLLIYCLYINIFKIFNPENPEKIETIVDDFINNDLKKFFIPTYSKEITDRNLSKFRLIFTNIANYQLLFLSRILINTNNGQKILTTILQDKDSLNLTFNELIQLAKFLNLNKEALSKNSLEQFNGFLEISPEIKKAL